MSQAIADLFRRITSGVYVIGVAAGDRRNAFTAAWVMPVSFDPLLLALSINPHHSSYELLRQGGAFSINVLSREQMDVARHFGAPASIDKLASVGWRKGRGGVPLLTEALAWFECDLAGEFPAGDHVLALGRVLNGALLQPNAEPLTYRDTGDMDGASAIFPDHFSGAEP
ncbi:flavin reductase family protein [Methylocaldum sp.]|uniref:flavin reductase family protein n=1 Tax=Methylocaldum sp. TaxID=1969727 RepID=UPI002D61FDF9|nr:flavin reductase family protein [Methylocaldum sp.]HYE36703.1 flavin reductase family protein [Methylocaldum sp.]